MKKIISLTFFILCFLNPQNSSSQQNESMRYEIMLDNTLIDESFKQEKFINCIDISPDNYITLSSTNKFYLLGWGGIASFGDSFENEINAFSYTSDGLLIAIKNDALCFVNESGSLEKIIQLPSLKMRLASGKDVVYLFDQKSDDNKYKLYAYAKGGKYKQILQAPKPINAIVEMKDLIYIAIGSAIFSFSPNTEALSLVTGLPKENEIKSITTDNTNNILYFSTNEGLYALQNENLVFITNDFPNTILKYFKGGLVVFNPSTNYIVRIVHIDKSIKF